MVKRIVITGVPKSGTAILHHMIHAGLPSWEYTPMERSYRKHLNREYVITKRPPDIFRLEEAINDKETAVIITCRDPFLVLTSPHRNTKNHDGQGYWVTADKFGKKGKFTPIDYYKKILEYKHKGQFIVYYEDWVNQPIKKLQDEIGQRFGVNWESNFENYINYPLPDDYKFLNIVRPIEPRKLKIRDITHLGLQLNKKPEFIKIRNKLGYGNIEVET